MEALVNRVKGYLNTLKANIYGAEYSAPEIYMKKIGYDQRDTMGEDFRAPGWEPFINGARWGGKDVHACFKTLFEVTDKMAGCDIWMQLRTGASDIWNTDNPQFLIYINGEIVCGMDMNHHEVRVCRTARPGDEFEIGVYAYSNSDTASDYFKLGFMPKFDEVEKLYYDVKVPMDACMEMRPDDLTHIDILKLLNEVVNRTELREVPSEEFYKSVVAADEWLQKEFYAGLNPSDSAVTVHSIGHTHIDVAWKWPVRQTREKVLRSFATVLNYMEDYPAYRFMSSTPQLYQFVKEQEPALFERIKARVKEGRWETEGAMWLEADCNLSSGEALVRQILKGQEFFREEFEADYNRVLWLPDVFGYSAALPQILKKSGIEYFMTTKINWNESNKMPHDLCLWKGIDGSEVLTYFITTSDHFVYPELRVNPRFETTYNGRQNVNQVMGTWQRFSDKNLATDVLTCYGYGDGGGGPTREMLEEDSRMALGIPGVPVTKQSFVGEFFDTLASDLEGKKIPKWNGELYLEYHRGTYTSQAANKKNNRLSEYKNEDAEWLSTWAGVVNPSFDYPADRLDKVWKTTLLNQFHDILPGSAIGEVYKVTDEEYREVLDTDRDLCETAAKTIAEGDGENICIFNPCSFERDDLVEGFEAPVLVKRIPAKGYRVISASDLHENDGKKSEFSFDSSVLQTPFYQVTFNKAGEIVSLYDKRASREVLQAGAVANRLIAFEDRPWEYDCWNIDSYYEEKSWIVDSLSEFMVKENSFERFIIHVERNFMKSLIKQDICFYRSSARIDFKTEVDWKEQQILLKAAFPVDVVTNKCTCDIQFGNVERPTHRNTSWDEARFEFCAHKWVDVSEADYGVALLNDCKYGYDVFESTMRITLIKSGIFPDPNADKGHHEFTYALFPHAGDFRRGGVVQEGYKLNRPTFEIGTGLPCGSSRGLIACDAPNVFCETIKRSEDGSATIIRLHEEYGMRTAFHLDLSTLGVKAVVAADLLERALTDTATSFSDGILTATIKPYELLTYRLN